MASSSPAERFARLRLVALPIVQTAVAATLAWTIARMVLGHERPFFAAVATIITLGTIAGQRARRAIEIAVGVALGIGFADLLILTIGTGTLQIGLVVALAMSGAVLLGGSPMLVTQAGVSAALVATLEGAASSGSFDRFLDALVGGGVAIAVSALFFPPDPALAPARAGQALLGALGRALEETAEALEKGDLDVAERALGDARGIDDLVDDFNGEIEVGRENARYVAPRRGARARLDVYARAGAQIDLAVRNTRVLARAATRLTRPGRAAPPPLPDAVRDLAEAVWALAALLESDERRDAVRAPALRAAGRATHLLEERESDLDTHVVVGQIRSTAFDLLRASGLEADEARRALETVSGRTERPAQGPPDGALESAEPMSGRISIDP